MRYSLLIVLIVLALVSFVQGSVLYKRGNTQSAIIEQEKQYDADTELQEPTIDVSAKLSRRLKNLKMGPRKHRKTSRGSSEEISEVDVPTLTPPTSSSPSIASEFSLESMDEVPSIMKQDRYSGLLTPDLSVESSY